jgi:hypothetical protein
MSRIKSTCKRFEQSFLQRKCINGQEEKAVIIRETQIKATMKYDLAPVRMAIMKKCWQGLEKVKPLCPIGRSVKWCSHHGKQSGGSFED